jgi:branched-chain amino acid transport system permease protein
LLPAIVVTLAILAALQFHTPTWALGVLAVTATALLGPPIYRLVFLPLAGSSVLVLLIVSMALHYVLLGAGLVLFGPEASRTPEFSDRSFTLGPMEISGHSLWVFLCCALLVMALTWLFRATLLGKALRATASNRLGARLMGIDGARTGELAFLLAAAIGGLAGLLIAPMTPIAYDSGFTIGLKGFVAAVLGGLVSYPAAAAGALAVGVIESLSSFWISEYSMPIVFGLLLPALAFLSLRRQTETE